MFWDTMQTLAAAGAGSGEAAFVAAGALTVGAGLSCAWRAPAPRPARWPPKAALSVVGACVAGCALVVAADPAALTTTPVAMALAAGVAEAGVIGARWLDRSRG